MADKQVVIGVYIKDRIQSAEAFQHLLTQYGCSVKTRLGLHDVAKSMCAPGGIIILEMTGDAGQIDEFYNKCSSEAGLDVQKMVFDV